MSYTMTLRDESVSGEVMASFTLECLTEEMSVREIIRARVYQEVADERQQRAQIAHALVQPVPLHRGIDWEQQAQKAEEGFLGNAFFVLVNDRQAESLDERFPVGVDTEITFVRLLPLAGG